MRVMAFNGSPRKKWNTATLLEKALEGAAAQGAETRLVHLYEIAYTGCMSCFACKSIGGKSYGRCAVQDGLTPVLREAEAADALIFGSPLYFGTVPGQMRSFMERLLFPLVSYTKSHDPVSDRRIRTAFIYTMNAPEQAIRDCRTRETVIGRLADEGSLIDLMDLQGSLHVLINEYVIKTSLGPTESLISCETYQFEDYSKVVSSLFDPEQRAQRRKEVFPKDCEKAFEIGMRLGRASR
jgi:multimeric flavodoxin WrbA